MLLMNEKQYNKWAQDVFRKFARLTERENNHLELTQMINCTYIFNTKNGKSAFARISPKDEYESVVGVAVAFTRYLHKEVPIKVKQISAAECRKLPVGTDMIVRWGSGSKVRCNFSGIHLANEELWFATKRDKVVFGAAEDRVTMDQKKRDVELYVVL
jgi:hypothetical protein